MLRKLSEQGQKGEKFSPGREVFLVTRGGELLEGYHIESVLMDLVSLDCSPLPDNDKQGFTIDGDRLRPNWCAGRKALVAGYLDRTEAEAACRRRQR